MKRRKFQVGQWVTVAGRIEKIHDTGLVSLECDGHHIIVHRRELTPLNISPRPKRGSKAGR